TIQVYTGFPQSADNDTKLSALPTVAEIWTYGTRTLTSFGTLVADIWASGTRSLTDKAGFFISGAKTTLDSLNDISLAGIWTYATRSLTDKLGFFISGTKTTLDDLNDLSIGDIQGEIQNGVLAKRIVVTGDPFSIVEGNIKTLVITLGPEWDLTDKLVYFAMSKIKSSDDPIINREVDTITDAVGGIAEIDLLSTETTPQGCYKYQIELRDDPADDDPETAMEGTAEITENLRS
ncbi:hypothetical protein KAR91_63265, partial [Candidatus Pacearchaeota archaeon]|nr:hypothetical protein [Candidatus Pacearchaeota archaeon]